MLLLTFLLKFLKQLMALKKSLHFFFFLKKKREARGGAHSRVSIPVMFSGSSNSFLLSSLFRSKRAESRLWQRGWSSLGGFRASCFSRSAAMGRWLGFLSKAASISSLMPGLQSSAISSNGGACLWICQQTNALSINEINIYPQQQKYSSNETWEVIYFPPGPAANPPHTFIPWNKLPFNFLRTRSQTHLSVQCSQGYILGVNKEWQLYIWTVAHGFLCHNREASAPKSLTDKMRVACLTMCQAGVGTCNLISFSLKCSKKYTTALAHKCMLLWRY